MTDHFDRFVFSARLRSAIGMVGLNESERQIGVSRQKLLRFSDEANPSEPKIGDYLRCESWINGRLGQGAPVMTGFTPETEACLACHPSQKDVEPMTDAEEVAECRGCRKVLRGKPYYRGGNAYDIQTGKEAKKCHYGGFVCSRECDFRACLELERSMPGHDYRQNTLGCHARESMKKWEAQ